MPPHPLGGVGVCLPLSEFYENLWDFCLGQKVTAFKAELSPGHANWVLGGARGRALGGRPPAAAAPPFGRRISVFDSHVGDLLWNLALFH